MRRWFVFFTACWVPFLHIGLLNNMGVIFVDVMETLNATRAQTAVIQSTAFGVGPAVGILSGVLIPNFGLIKCSVFFSTLASVGVMTSFLATEIWHMVVSFGVLFGAGTVNLFICSALALSQHFTGRKRLFMLSLQTTAAGLSGTAYPFILSYLSSSYGFRGALLIIGGLSLNCIPGCFIWKHTPTVSRKKHNKIHRIITYQAELAVNVVEEGNSVAVQKPEQDSSTKENDIYYIQSFPVLPNQRNTKRVSIVGQIPTLDHGQETKGNQTLIASMKAVLSNRYFILFWIGTALAFSALSMPLIFLGDIYVDKGLSEDDTAFGFLLLNILNIIGRLIPGVIMQMQCASVFVGPLLSTSVAVVAMVGIVFASSRWIMILFSAVIGLPIGMIQAMLSVVSASLVGVNNLTAATGLIFTTFGITNIVLGPVVGYIRDVIGSYEISIFAAAGMTGLAALLFMVALIQRSLESSKVRRRSSVFYLTSF